MADEAHVEVVPGEPEPMSATSSRSGRIVVIALAVLVVVAVVGLGLGNRGSDRPTDSAAEEAETGSEDDEREADEPTERKATEDEADGDDEEAADDTLPEPAPEGDLLLEVTSNDIAGGDWYGSSPAPMPWQNGFLFVGQRFVPSDLTMGELVPDIADRFPPEIIEALEAAGLDVGSAPLAEAERVLRDADLYSLASQVVADDPELVDAYFTVNAGGEWVPAVQRSSDGLTWEDVDLELPDFTTTTPVVSNGTHLVAAILRGHDVHVFTTDDLLTWTETVLPTTVGTYADHISVDPFPNNLVIDADGWYVEVETWTNIDLWSMLPEEIRLAENISWSPEPDGIRIDFHSDGTTEYVPWSSLPTTYDEYFNHVGSEPPQAFVGDFVGAIEQVDPLPGVSCCQISSAGDGFLALGSQPVPNEVTMRDLVPDIDERFPREIIDALTAAELDLGEVGSDLHASTSVLQAAGLMDLATQTVTADPVLFDAYMTVISSTTYESIVFWSADGRSWAPVSVPDVQYVSHISPVEGGLLLIGSNEEDDLPRYFVGPADGSVWEEVDGPEIGTFWPYFYPRASGAGLGVVVDLGGSFGPANLSWESSIEHDGIEVRIVADDEGWWTVTVTDLATEEIRSEWTGPPRNDSWIRWGSGNVDFLDEFGTVVVSIPQIQAETELFNAETEAWEAWIEANPYSPALTLIATIDGRTWHTIEFEYNREHYDAAVTVVDGVAVFLLDDSWYRVELP